MRQNMTDRFKNKEGSRKCACQNIIHLARTETFLHSDYLANKYREKSYRFEMYLNGKVNFWWCAKLHNLSSFICTICYLNLKEEPLVNKTGLGLGLGSSNRRKKAWYSTQIFQNTLQQSLLPIMNSRVSWQLLCYREQRHFVLFFLLKHLN